MKNKNKKGLAFFPVILFSIIIISISLLPITIILTTRTTNSRYQYTSGLTNAAKGHNIHTANEIIKIITSNQTTSTCNHKNNFADFTETLNKIKTDFIININFEDLSETFSGNTKLHFDSDKNIIILTTTASKKYNGIESRSITVESVIRWVKSDKCINSCLDCYIPEMAELKRLV